MFKNAKPFFFENSKVPVWLSKLAPIEINAITLGPLVFSRGEISEKTKRHETIHYQQYIELLFIGFLVIYLYDYLYAAIIKRKGFTRDHISLSDLSRKRGIVMTMRITLKHALDLLGGNTLGESV